jgi:hypothetical protein
MSSTPAMLRQRQRHYEEGNIFMRRQLTEAARECRSTTFTDAADQIEFIHRLARSIADQFDRIPRIEVIGSDIVVTFSGGMGPRAA